MSRLLSEDVVLSVKELITEITGFEKGTDVFNYVFKHITNKLKKSDTMYFLNKRDVDRDMAGMAEKFCFHGFFSQAAAVEIAYNNYIPENLQKSVKLHRLNVVKFLLSMSERPTIKFLEKPEEYEIDTVDEVQEINWTEYLNEGIERWSPNFDESSDESDVSNIEEHDGADKKKDSRGSFLQVVIDMPDRDVLLDLKTNREELLTTVQHTWFHQDGFRMEPESSWNEANIGILWAEHLKKQIKGMIFLKDTSIISEYNVIREILWQFWCPHTSSTLELSGNILKPRSDVTIASVRAPAFYRFMNQFIPYIELLEYFREFSKSVAMIRENIIVPRTYRSYSQSVNNIIGPVYKKLCEIEDEVRKQETTFTILRLAYELNKIFEPIKLLKDIHKGVIIDFNSNTTALTCTTELLCRLHDSLQNSMNKLEQDLRVTLFLESLYHYFRLIDSWLMKDDLDDYTGEFVIRKDSECVLWEMNFEVRPEVTDFCRNNSFLKIICEKVLQIGRNVNFLRLLGKYDIVGDYRETIHDEFVRKTLEQLCFVYNVNSEDLTDRNENEMDMNCNNENYIFPVVCTDVSKNVTEMDRLENLVDVNDGFLMTAFADFFVRNPEAQEVEKPTLYQKVSKITKNLFPKTNFFEKIFLGILDERFTISGLIVKNILVEQHQLEKQFQFLRHLYLFFDDMIFPFYRRLFEKTNSYNKHWGNTIWLTSHLQDIIMDVYPEFYAKCSVQVKDDWNECTDSLNACKLIDLNYDVQWPLNIIITPGQMAMYKEIFHFLLELKWALYTVNHLAFTDLEPKKRSSIKINLHNKKTLSRLKFLKFNIINILNNVQHFIFGFVFSKCLMKFELNFEKANDLTSLIESHKEFIDSAFKMILEVRACMVKSAKSESIIYCIRLLKAMWSSSDCVSNERIADCYKIYKSFYNEINPIIFPVYIFDY